jgi:hypothetical protein
MKIAKLATAFALALPALAQGPIQLYGVDAEDGGHGSLSLYADLMQVEVLDSVTNGGSGLLVIGGGKNPADSVTDWWTDLGGVLGVPVSFINGTTDIATADLGGYAVLCVPSTSWQAAGGLTPAENAALNTRAADLAAHIQSGGGLVALEQGNVPYPYAFLAQVYLFQSGGGSYTNLTPTPYGSTLGITDTNLDFCCWHNTFTVYPPYLTPLAVNALTGQPAILSGKSDGVGSEQIISSVADGALSVFAADLDADGDNDILSASRDDDTVAWYENLGAGSGFGPRQVISNTADTARSVYAADLDGDGDQDVLAACFANQADGRILWFENQGGSFGPQNLISTTALGAFAVHSADLDADGDLDVVSASYYDDKIAWYENDGAGNFQPEAVISTNAIGAQSVHTADIDGDGDPDVVSASFGDNKVAWYENLGAALFGPQQVVSQAPQALQYIRAADIDGDGDVDLMTASRDDNMLAWFENLGAGSFDSLPRVITTEAMGARSCFAADIDGDGDLDALSASMSDNKVAWYENLGSGVFGPQQVVSNTAMSARSVVAADVDGDADADIISASRDDDKIAWYETFLCAEDCDGDGQCDGIAIIGDPSLDWNGDGVLDTCSPATYCSSTPNSGSSGGALIAASGSPRVSDDSFTLIATGCAPLQFSYFVMSQSQAFVPGFGGSQGNLCVGAPIVRLNIPNTGQVDLTDAVGTRSYSVAWDDVPAAATIAPGETWNFQLWFRDTNPTVTSNTSNGIQVMFR